MNNIYRSQANSSFSAHNLARSLTSILFFSCLILSHSAYAGNLGNFIWNDLDSDGIQDAQEPGVADVTVHLFVCSDDTTSLIATTTSDSLGKFLFSDLPEAHYQLQFDQPTGYQFTLNNQGDVAWLASAVDPITGITPCILVREAASILGFDAGVISDPTNTILVNVALNKHSEQSSTSYNGLSSRAVDGNLSGRYSDQSITHTDINELNPWWQVDLAEQHDMSSIIIYNRTDNCCTSRLEDVYIFISSAPFGDRSLSELTADSSIDSRFHTGVVGESLTFDFSETQGRYVRVQLADNATLSLAEVEILGSLATGPTPVLGGNLGEKIWLDLNSNGIQEPEEPGVAGVNVELIECFPDSITPVQTTTSDSSGEFLFSDLPEAYYRLRFNAPVGYEFTLAEQGNIGWLDSNPDPETGITSCIQVRESANILGYDAGLVEVDQTPPSGEKMNVLFIMVDDLRPELGAYDVDEIQTPGIDELAQQGVVFNRAYSQFSTCSPSRTSLMTGLRPDTTQVTDLTTDFRDTIPGAVTLPQYFKEKGYRTQSLCKVFHGGDLTDPVSWTEDHQDYFGTGKVLGPDGKKLPYASVDKPDNQFSEYGCATLAIDAIGESQADNSPFFIAVGFRKPHLPLVAPKPYFDMYDKYAIPEASNMFKAHEAPSFAFENLSELNDYSGIPENASDFSEDFRRELKQAYYAATSFVDAQVQRLLDELDSAGLSDNTIVVLLGDHGFHLGEQNDWGKHTNFEVGSRVPLIIKTPGKTVNMKTDALAELVDLFPTVVELAGLPIPTAAQNGGYPLEGDSLVEFIDNPTAASTRGAFSQWSRGGYKGVSVRTDRWRFTHWVNIFNGAVVNELYDHLIDPSETQNLANLSQHAATVTALEAVVTAGGQADMPQEFQ